MVVLTLCVYIIGFVMLYCLKIWRLTLGGMYVRRWTYSLVGDFDCDLICFIVECIVINVQIDTVMIIL